MRRGRIRSQFQAWNWWRLSARSSRPFIWRPETLLALGQRSYGAAAQHPPAPPDAGGPTSTAHPAGQRARTQQTPDVVPVRAYREHRRRRAPQCDPPGTGAQANDGRCCRHQRPDHRAGAQKKTTERGTLPPILTVRDATRRWPYLLILRGALQRTGMLGNGRCAERGLLRYDVLDLIIPVSRSKGRSVGKWPNWHWLLCASDP
jgi:hypothetical protein